MVSILGLEIARQGPLQEYCARVKFQVDENCRVCLEGGLMREWGSLYLLHRQPNKIIAYLTFHK